MHNRLVVLAVLLIPSTAVGAGDEPRSPLGPGAVVRIHAPKTIHIPDVLTATPEGTVSYVMDVSTEGSHLVAKVGGSELPIATPKPGETMTGRIVSMDSAGLVVAPLDGHGAVVRVPSAAIARLDISRGKTSRIRRALVGGAVGLGVGLALTGIAAATGCEGWCTAPTEPGGALLFATPALTVGGIAIGAALSPGERWQAVPRREARLNLGPAGRDGVGVRVSLSF